MTPAQAAKILARRKAIKLQQAMKPIDLFNAMFAQQANFIRDPSRLKALFCTRRAAKSYTAGLYMVHEALTHPGCNVLFIGLTRDSAKRIIWKDILRVLNNSQKLQAKFNVSELTMSFPNGSLIKIAGIDSDEDEMNKWLGGKYRLVCIDEASMFTINLAHFVYDILKPAMADLDGTVCLMGTSSNFKRGLFYDITNHKEAGWSLHTWTAHDNPFIAKQWQKELDEIKRDRPLYMSTPQFKQWFLNEWVVEDDKLVYKYDSSRNLYDSMPKHLKAEGFSFVLGVDTGWEDDNAFVLCAYHQNDPNFYVLKTYKKNKMTFDQVEAKIQEFMADPYCAPNKIVIDGANKQGVESMRARTNIPFEFADKQGKVDFIEMLNADLIQAKVKIHVSNKDLMEELVTLTWKTDGDKIKFPKAEHPSQPNHLCDAFLYAWRNGYHYHSTPQEEIIVQGSKEWYEQQSENIWERERERIIQESNKSDWGDEGGFGVFG